MTRRPATALLAAALAAALLAPPPATGSVFARIRRTPSAAMEALGGVAVGESVRVELNGADGTLRTFAFERPAAELLASVNAELRRIDPGAPDETGLWID